MDHKIRRAATVTVATGGAFVVFTGVASAHFFLKTVLPLSALKPSAPGKGVGTALSEQFGEPGSA